LAKPKILKPWSRLGFYLSLTAGLFLTFLSWILMRFMSWPLITLMLAILVLFSAVLVKIGSKIIGGFLVASLSFLWWYFSIEAPNITLDAVLINLRSPMGVMSTIGLALGIVAGTLDITEAVLADFQSPQSKS